MSKQVRKGAEIRPINLVDSFVSSFAGKSPSSKQQGRIVGTAFTYMAGHDPKAWTRDHVYAYLQQNEEKSRGTQYVYAIQVRSFLGFHGRMDLAKLVKPPHRLEAGKPYIESDQIDRILKVAEKPLERCLIQTLFHTGLRVGELVHLEIGDFDLDKRQFRIEAKEAWMPKNYKGRIVPVDTKTASTVKEYIGDRTKGRIFNVSETYVRRIVKDLVTKAGLGDLKITPHTFRRSYAVHALKHGMDLRTLQKLLGHSVLTSTATYLQLTDRDVAEAYDKVFEKKEAQP
jgi:integrase